MSTGTGGGPGPPALLEQPAQSGQSRGRSPPREALGTKETKPAPLRDEPGEHCWEMQDARHQIHRLLSPLGVSLELLPFSPSGGSCPGAAEGPQNRSAHSTLGSPHGCGRQTEKAGKGTQGCRDPSASEQPSLLARC